jgi:hypothetical protein
VQREAQQFQAGAVFDEQRTAVAGPCCGVLEDDGEVVG